MKNLLIHEYRIKANNISKKIIYHFSDCHLTEWDSLSDTAEIEKAKAQTDEWENIRKYFATSHNEPFELLSDISARKHFENLVNASKNGDAVILAGDTFDYPNRANIRLIESKLSELECPYMLLCGNHDKPKDYPENSLFDSVKEPYQIMDLGDLIIFGMDDSSRNITRNQLQKLKELLEGEKPIIIAMHIPILTEGNKEKLEKCGEYFYINYPQCPKENIEFIELIKENSNKIICVFAGHLHFADNTEIVPGLIQYVSSQGIMGNLNKYVIGE